MALFDLPSDKSKKQSSKSGSQIKLKKGDTVQSLIETAKKLVDEKLGNYKKMSRCVTNVEDLQSFFDETPENAYMAIDTETTGLNTFTDTLVGVCLCNRKTSHICTIKS